MTGGTAYSKEDLRRIVSACFVLAIIDEHIDEKELDPIFSFLEENWQSDYGVSGEMADGAKDRAFEIMRSGKMYTTLEKEAQELAASLDKAQKERVLVLLVNVMKADAMEGKRELKMFRIFLTALYDPDTVSTDTLKAIVSLLVM